ncbi:MAG TPA: YbhN family protein [Acidimicrobiales bacterium]|nr:YbhN family protein [Acidimicrobiales bacterium]
MADLPEVDGPPVDATASKRRRKLLGWIPRPLRHGVALFILLVFLEYVVIPSFLHSKARSSLSQLGRVNFLWLLAGFGLEAGALAAYGRLTQSVLPKDGPSFSKVFRIDLSTLAVSHVIPGGTAGGTGLGYRLFTSNGVAGADAGFALATQGIGSAVVLNAMLWVALVISIPLHGFNSAYVTVAVVGAVLLAAFGVLVLSLTRGEQHATRALQAVARRVPWVTEEQMGKLVERLATRLRTLGSDRQLLKNAVLWAAANWLLDAASLWAFVAAYHHLTSPIDLFVAYGVANILAAVPLTPGGLGIVEAVAATTLIGFHVPVGTAWLGVISWRLFNFWLPIPVGAGAYLSLRVERGAGLRERRHVLEDMTRPRDPSGPPSGEMPMVRPNQPPRMPGSAAPPAPSAPPQG